MSGGGVLGGVFVIVGLAIVQVLVAMVPLGLSVLWILRTFAALKRRTVGAFLAVAWAISYSAVFVVLTYNSWPLVFSWIDREFYHFALKQSHWFLLLNCLPFLAIAIFLRSRSRGADAAI